MADEKLSVSTPILVTDMKLPDDVVHQFERIGMDLIRETERAEKAETERDAALARVRELEDQILAIRKSVQQEYKHVSSYPYSLSGSAYLNSIERIRTALDPNWRQQPADREHKED